ncbi:putative thymidylate synthase [Schizosaccharomyces pombe]|uniref:Probable thymidylate synthase n=1 Tax=Schizosaccharomyces pombe (strain 972 / ATCC 24843) TaxID=284812 RepID=TYSY_SCHPO|nr:putative thymidylate synthase [Schizosaccharomyces pombe]Q9UTI7.1 RecName: Full=Probable thymidylate synthase; Short=TS; Short=TSase [Schizosaccharomyces pombe 972h-]CAB52423.1 thymidylate synthase (predicted) [Schizosaccharomyces pombe]|eukprot:NP_594305.1 putative thymidylate synthase [Schizosaccharomyces pombe]
MSQPLHARFATRAVKNPMILEKERQLTDSKYHILVAATGSVAAIKLTLIVKSLLTYKGVDVQVVLTDPARNFVEKEDLTALGVNVYNNADDWKNWDGLECPITHIELRRWAHLLLIAPLSANTMAKMANGLCDNLLTSLIRAWAPLKPILLAPAMNTLMWTNPITQEHLSAISRIYKNSEFIMPIEKVLACGDIGMGGMAEWRNIVGRVADKLQLEQKSVLPNAVKNIDGQDDDSSEQTAAFEEYDDDDDDDVDDNEQSNSMIETSANADITPKASLLPSTTESSISKDHETSQAPLGSESVDTQASENVTTKPEPPVPFTSSEYRNTEEEQYLNLIRYILENGQSRPDRTGTGTRSVFAPPQLRFSLRNNTLPLLTTKRVFLRGVLEELLWFIHGDTNANHLSEKGIHIWDGNGSREFLDSRGLTDRKVGDLGPIYGFQWRHFGAQYVDCDTDYTNKGVDQLAQVISTLKLNPYDRRIILSAWNPLAIPEMALPPCHIFCQFYVSEPCKPGGKPQLSSMMYQRSADMGLGVPFNIASYSLLTHMIAHMCGYEAAEFVHVMGDCHIYNDHLEALQTQLERVPKAFPKLFFKRDAKDIGSIDSFSVDDFAVEGYNPYGPIKMKMSV